MAIKNRVILYINGRNQTAGLVLPVKFGEFLDEQLDEARVSLRQVKTATYAPLSPVELTVENKLYFGDTTVKKRSKTYYMVVADDTATESPPHSKLYDHELYLLEVTKLLERIVVDTIL